MPETGVAGTQVRAPLARLLPCLLAVALLGLLAGCGGRSGQTGSPDGTRTGARTAAETTPGPVVLDVTTVPGRSARPASLPPGRPPEVPWFANTVLHSQEGDVEVNPMQHHSGDLGRVVPYAGGAIVGWLGGPGTNTLRFLDPGGRRVRTVTGEGPLPSPDGTRVAWWEYQRRQVVIASTSGQVLDRVPAPRSWSAEAPGSGQGMTVSVVGWVGPDEVLLQKRVPGVGQGAALDYWRTSGTAVPRWPFVDGADATVATENPDRTLVLGRATHGGPEPDCLAAYPVDSPRPLWRHCYRRHGESFGAVVGRSSPDGRHLLVTGTNQTSGTRMFTVVVDTATGRPVVRFDHGRWHGDRVGSRYGVRGPGVRDAAFADDGHVLLAVFEQSRPLHRPHLHNLTGAVVRCDLRLRCEYAAAPQRWTQRWDRPLVAPAYALP